VMTISMNSKNNKKTRPGVALLVVLFIVMAITILSLGFVSRSDVELACGRNMLLRTQLDYLAESGLEHAKGLILNPQDVAGSGYWGGGTNLQLTSGSDFYEVKVERDASDLCNYIIDSNSYRLEGTEKIGLSCLQAMLRIDPCIAYWVGSNTTVWSQMTIKGDVYCGGTLTNNSVIGINGDVFADGLIGTNHTGQEKPTAEVGLAWPNLAVEDFSPAYYIGSTLYSAEIIDANHPAGPFGPTGTNPAGIRYSTSDVNMPSNVNINGTLVVNGTLRIKGSNIVITAVKNFPALLVIGQVIMEDGASLEINGLAQVVQEITEDPNTTNASISVIGGLFIANGGVTSDKVNINITTDPAIASIETWPDGITPSRWSPAAGAFFRSIERK
jgi:hypothetical protein